MLSLDGQPASWGEPTTPTRLNEEAMTQIPEALSWCLAVGTAVGAVTAPLLVHSRRRMASLRRNEDLAGAERDALAQEKRAFAAHAQALAEESRHLATVRLPAMADHLTHRHLPVPGPLHTGFEETEVGQDHAAALQLLVRAVEAERLRVDEAAQATMRGATTVMQAMSYRLQSGIVEMQERYDDPRLAEDLLALDQLNEQNLRRIQATGVLCGAWPGLSRADSHLGDIVVGAKSRVRGFQRIQVNSQLADPVGVVSRAVEPIAVTVTELLANAVHHTHGTLAVDVSLHQTSSGACVVIDDAGVGMHADEIEYATAMMSGRLPVRLTELGDPPRTGFAVIGRLIQQYGFAVSVDKPAPYGGVRAVVFIPGHLLTVMDEQEQPMSVSAPLPPLRTTATRAPAPAPAPVASAAGSAPGPVPVSGSEELPRRRRRRPVPTTAQDAAPAAEDTREEHSRSPEQTGATWASFQAGTASGRAAVRETVRETGREAEREPAQEAGREPGQEAARETPRDAAHDVPTESREGERA